MYPLQHESDKSFMGDHTLVQPVTAQEIRMLKTAIDHHIDERFDTLMSALALSSPSEQITTHHKRLPDSMYPPLTRPSDSIHPTVTSPRPSTLPLSTRLTAANNMNEPLMRDSPNAPNTHTSFPAPIPGVRIPDIKPGPSAWKVAIDQWENSNEHMDIALRDWPAEWYTGHMRNVTGTKRSNRKLIYEEFVR